MNHLGAFRIIVSNLSKYYLFSHALLSLLEKKTFYNDIKFIHIYKAQSPSVCKPSNQ